MKEYEVAQIGDLYCVVKGRNQIMVTTRLMPKEDAEAICNSLNEAQLTSEVFEIIIKYLE